MSPHTDYRLIITDPALEDIEAIANFTTLQWGEQQAIVYKGVLAQALQQLQAAPEQGRTRYGVSPEYKGWTAGAHVIFYRLERETIYVVRILHGSMDFARHLL